MDNAGPRIPAWWSLQEHALCEALDSSREGLGADVAAARLRVYGLNDLHTTPRHTRLLTLWNQLRSPLLQIGRAHV